MTETNGGLPRNPAQRGGACAVNSQARRAGEFPEAEFISAEDYNPEGFPMGFYPIGRKPGYEEMRAELEAKL